MKTGQPLVQVRNLSVEFRSGDTTNLAVKGVSFEINKGETVALVGESGSGKTVSALSILRLLPYPAASHPTGEILYDGKDLLKVSEAEMRDIRGARISIIFQEPMTSLNPLHTIEKQVGEVLKVHRGLDDKAIRARVLELLRRVGLRDPEKRLSAFPHQLSGGQRQRVMIAMALANEPDLLIADEPTTALDVTVEAQILDLLRRMQRDHGTALLLITHDMAVVAEMADRVVVMYAGQVVEQGPVREVLRSPYNPYTRALIDSIPMPTTPRNRPMPAISGSVPTPAQLPPGCRFHPRCPSAQRRCGREVPPLLEVGVGRASRCWLHETTGASPAAVGGEVRRAG